MADLRITFCKTLKPGLIDSPVPRGRDVRTSILTIAGASAATADAAGNNEFAVLKAAGDCWVQVAAAPVAAAMTSGGTQAQSMWFLAAGEIMAVACESGDKVAVITA